MQAQLWSQGRKPEQVEGIRFQKIWRIPEAEYRVHSLRDILISQGARHTGKRLEEVVVVVQTVLVSECSVSGTSE